MIKFSFEYEQNTDIVSRTPQETYHDVNTLDIAILNKTHGDKLLKLATNIYTGVAEEPLLHIEDEWFTNQAGIQDAKDELNKVSDLDKVISDPNSDQMALDSASYDMKAIIGEYDDKSYADVLATYRTDKQTTIDDFTTKRNEIEDGSTGTAGVVIKPSLWLKAYRGVTTKATRPTITVVIPPEVKKKIIAHERDRTVRSLEDTVADLAKSNSLLLSMISSIYGALSTTAQNSIPVAEKAIIDHAVASWKTTSTRGDRQLQVEGTKLIDKLYSREVAIADIVDKYNK